MSDTPPPPPPPPPPPGGAMPPPPPVGPAPAGSGIPVGAAFSWGWNKFTQDVGPWILIALVLLGINIVVAVIRFAAANSGGFFVQLILGAVGLVVGYIAWYGLVNASLQVTEGQRADVGRAWNLDKFGNFFLTALLEGIIVGVGFILCVIPGIIFGILLFFAPFFAIDKNMKPVDALKASWAITTKNFGNVFVFLLAALGVYILGFLVCFVGILVAGPVVLLAGAYAYKTLTNQPISA
jgi:uncharacterized membrane protein